jgi:UDP:flavonoid glycosyltransferase YjiC (YdhE family)
VVRTIVTYVSGHGFGHASRTIALLNALADRAPDIRLIVRSAVAPWLFARTARPTVVLEPLECDTGAVQIGSLHLDPGETVRRAQAFMRDWPARVAAEAAVLRAHGATLVLADIPPLGIAAAKAAGLPAVAMSNFTWDWIYAAYPGTSDLSRAIGDVYAGADLALRLPLWGGFATFPRIVDLPFIARRSRRHRDEVRRAFDLPLDRPLALVSFGGYGVEGLDLAALASNAPWALLMTSTTPVGDRTLGDVGRTGSLIPLDEPDMYARGFLYEDIVRAMDVVVSKPGYGIIAECVANQTALLYTSRGHFAEYDVLVAGLPRVLPSAFIDHEALFAGRWAPHLDALLAQPAPSERPRVDGADVAAALLLGMM